MAVLWRGGSRMTLPMGRGVTQLPLGSGDQVGDVVQPLSDGGLRIRVHQRMAQEGSCRLKCALRRAAVTGSGGGALGHAVTVGHPEAGRGPSLPIDRESPSAGGRGGWSPRAAPAVTRVATPAGIFTPGRDGGMYLHLFL
uniref:Uncharacterized protein n=1 Tax=Oryza meridionalis TaxID=40149 RepID=A0A0E0E4L0_9ORYZ